MSGKKFYHRSLGEKLITKSPIPSQSKNGWLLIVYSWMNFKKWRPQLPEDEIAEFLTNWTEDM